MRRLEQLLATTRSGSAAHDFGLLALRLMVAIPMVVVYGINKLPIEAGFLRMVERMGLPAPVFFAWSGALAELVGGTLLAVGLLTRGAAAAIISTLTVALVVYHRGHAFEHREKALMYAVMLLVLLLIGPGRFSLDQLWLSRRARLERRDAEAARR